MASTGIYPNSVQVGGVTFSTGQGGSIEVELIHGSRDVQERTGNDLYPTVVYNVDYFAEAIINVRECAFAALPTVGGSAASVVLTIGLKTGTTVRTFTNMIVTNVATRQGRAEPGMTTIRAVYQAATGSTAPES